MHRALRIFLKVCVVSLFIPYMLACIPILTISWILSFVSKPLSIKMASITSYLGWSLFDCLLKLSIKPIKPIDVPKDSFLVISNHTGAIDFMLVNALNKHYFKDTKYTIKQSLWAIPIFYQGCVLLNFLVLKRTFEKDRSIIEKYIGELDKMGLPTWFVLFVEGHRFTQARSEESSRFCKERGIIPYKNVLCPRTKGFELVSQRMKGSYIKKVLDLTFYCRDHPTLLSILFSGELYDVRYDARIVELNDIKDPVQFLEESFRRKDDLIEKWKCE